MFLYYNHKMNSIRWYDKNPNLKDVFEFLEGLDERLQRTIAKDILQILVNDFNFDFDYELNRICKHYNFDCKRWYDKDIDLFSSFEIIKTLSPKLQDLIAKKIIENIVFIYLKEGV